MFEIFSEQNIPQLDPVGVEEAVACWPRISAPVDCAFSSMNSVCIWYKSNRWQHSDSGSVLQTKLKFHMQGILQQTESTHALHEGVDSSEKYELFWFLFGMLTDLYKKTETPLIDRNL